MLAAPVAIFAPGLTVVRLWFSTLSSVGLVAAYWPWLRVLHPGVAPVAALLFSTTWFTLYFGPGVMPNLYLGLAAVAAVGMFLRAVDSPRWWRSTLCGAAAALAALVRPTDSVLALAPLLVCGLAVPRLRRARELAAVAAGLIIGWVPWLVEAYVRFGGPLTRLRNAETAGPGGLSLDLKNLLVYPRLLDGRPTYCCTGPPSEAGPIPWMFTAWLTAIPVLALLGVLVAARRGQLPEMVLVGLPAVLSTGFYLLLPSFTSLRFLLPAFALIFLPVAALLVASLAVGRWWARGISVALAVALLLGHLTLMLPNARGEFAVDAPGRKRQILVAAALRSHIQGRPCLVVGIGAGNRLLPGVSGAGCSAVQTSPQAGRRRPEARACCRGRPAGSTCRRQLPGVLAGTADQRAAAASRGLRSTRVRTGIRRQPDVRNVPAGEPGPYR